MPGKVRTILVGIPPEIRFSLFLISLATVVSAAVLLRLVPFPWTMLSQVFIFTWTGLLLLRINCFPRNGQGSIPRSKFLIHLSAAGFCLMMAGMTFLMFLQKLSPNMEISGSFYTGVMFGSLGQSALILLCALIDAGGVNPLIDQVCNIRTYRDRHPKTAAVPHEPEA